MFYICEICRDIIFPCMFTIISPTKRQSLHKPWTIKQVHAKTKRTTIKQPMARAGFRRGQRR